MAGANNVTWSTPPPAAVGGYPIVVPEAQLAEAVGNAPAALAERNAKTAESQATQQMAPLQVEGARLGLDNMRAQAQSAALKAEDEQLARISGPLAANPALANSPAVRSILGPILQRRGLDIPMNAQGQVDAHGLMSILAPPKPASELSPDMITKVLEQPPGDARRAILQGYSGYDPSLLTAPQALSETAQTAVRKNYDAQYYRAVTGNMTPKEFMAWMNSERSALVGSNIDPSAIDRDPSILSGLGAKTEADIEKLATSGLLNQSKAAQAREDIKKAQTVEDLNRVHAKYLGAQIHMLSVHEQTMLQNANVNAARAATYQAEVGQRIANAQNGSWADRQRLLAQDLKTVVQERDKAAMDARMLTVAAQQAINAGETPGDDLLHARDEAIKRRDAFANTVTQIKDPSTAARAIGSALSSVTGNAVSVPGGATAKFDKGQALPSRSQPWLYQMPDKSVWDTRAQPPKMISPPG